MAVDQQAAEAAILAFLHALGHDPAENEELRGTPRRVAEAFATDLLSGYDVDVPKLLQSGSATQDSTLVVMRDLHVATVCPHHLLPSLGRATLAYVPGERVFGLGTLTRLLDAFCRRLTLQEEIGKNVVHALVADGKARGAACMLQLSHACLAARGPRRPEALVVTVARAGLLAAEDLAILNLPEDTPCRASP